MIDFQGVTKSFSGYDILRDVSFRVNPGERVGIVGPNGSGKSTIFNLITGVTTQDSGRIAIPNDYRLGIMRQKIETADLGRDLLEFTSDAIPELRAYTREIESLEQEMTSGGGNERKLARHGFLQTQIEHLGAYHLEQEAKEVLSSLGFSIESFGRPISELSGGWQMRASLARVLISHPDVLMLDEPSNYLDVPAVEWLCRFLNTFHGTLMLISHDRFLLRKLAKVILEVNNSHVVRYAGDYDYYCRERESRQKLLVAAKTNQDRERDRMERVIDRFRAKSTKAAQAKSWQKKLEKMEDINVPDELKYKGRICFPKPPAMGVSEAARFEDVSFGYTPAKTLYEHVDLSIAPGDKIAVIGYNGLGKTTLLKLLDGVLKPTAGRVVIGSHSIIGYQAQEFSDLVSDEMSVWDAVKSAMPPLASRSNLMNILGTFGFSGDDVEKPCGVLSGGERIRVQFARIFVNPPNLLILDEPTTHLDLAMREILQQAIVEFNGTVCLVSHDIEFVRGTATTIIEVKDGRVRKYYGGYDYYVEKSQEFNAGEARPRHEAGAQGKASEITAKQRRQQRANARRAISAEFRNARENVARLEAELDSISARRKVIVAKLASGEKQDFAGMRRELASIDSRISEIENQWETATLELEALRLENDRINSQ